MESHLKTQQCLLVIDTDALMQRVPNPSQKQTAPTALPDGVAFMIQNASPKAAGSFLVLDGGFEMNCRIGSILFFRSLTITQNSSDAALIYAVLPGNLTKPGLGQIQLTTLPEAVEPDPTQMDGLPPLNVEQTFSAMKGFFLRKGVTNVLVGLAVYQLDGRGERQEPWGYFSLKIPVNVL